MVTVYVGPEEHEVQTVPEPTPSEITHIQGTRNNPQVARRPRAEFETTRLQHEALYGILALDLYLRARLQGARLQHFRRQSPLLRRARIRTGEAPQKRLRRQRAQNAKEVPRLCYQPHPTLAPSRRARRPQIPGCYIKGAGALVPQNGAPH
jgi:hypothetical protein